MPAPGQGALGVQTRTDGDVPEAVRRIDDHASHAAFDTERRLVSLLGGGCALPLGVLATADGARLSLRAAVFRPDGSGFVAASAEGAEPALVAGAVGDELFAGGARLILEELR